MAVIVLTNAFVTVGGTDLSDHVTQVEISYSAAEIDSTAMGPSGFQAREAGLKDWSVTLTFQQDFAASKTDAVIFPLVGTKATVQVKPVNAATSATNPQYSGSALVNDYKPLANSVGELGTVQVTWPGSGTLTRATS